MSDLTTSTNSRLKFRLAETQQDFTAALPLVILLNPKMTEASFWQYVKEMQAYANYNLYLASRDNVIVGICGCWIATKFYCGKYLEIDNFIIHPNHQRKGYGRYFLLFIERLAREENCETIMLDAFLDNKKAHDFYKSEGYEPKGYHFLKVIGHKAP